MNKQFDWLREQRQIIKNRRFHLVHCTEAAYPWEIQTEWPVPPPESYRTFLAEFGACRLFRMLSYWMINVYDRPVPYTDDKGTKYLKFGGWEPGMACFSLEDLRKRREPAVYETRGVSGLFVTAPNFVSWIESKAKSARRRYRSAEWKAVVDGPKPFSSEELAIIEARRLFEWQLLSVSEEGMMRFSVTNRSSVVLARLSLGIRGPRLFGCLYLDVSSVLPGQTKTVEQEGYTSHFPRSAQVAFHLPDPLPEDREQYTEFDSQTA